MTFTNFNNKTLALVNSTLPERRRLTTLCVLYDAALIMAPAAIKQQRVRRTTDE